MFKETKNMGKIKTFSKEAFSPEGLDDPSSADAFATEWDIEGLDSYIVSKQIIDDEYVVKIESAFEIIWFGFKTIDKNFGYHVKRLSKDHQFETKEWAFQELK